MIFTLFLLAQGWPLLGSRTCCPMGAARFLEPLSLKRRFWRFDSCQVRFVVLLSSCVWDCLFWFHLPYPYPFLCFACCCSFSLCCLCVFFYYKSLCLSLLLFCLVSIFLPLNFMISLFRSSFSHVHCFMFVSCCLSSLC